MSFIVVFTGTSSYSHDQIIFRVEQKNYEEEQMKLSSEIKSLQYEKSLELANGFTYVNLIGLSHGNANYSSKYTGSASNIQIKEINYKTYFNKKITFASDVLQIGAGMDINYKIIKPTEYLTNLNFKLYDRKILHLFAPISLAYEFKFQNNYVKSEVAYGKLLYGITSSSLGDELLENRQRKGKKIEIKLSQEIKSYNAGIFLNHTNIEQSDKENCLGGNFICSEPANKTNSLGIFIKKLF